MQEGVAREGGGWASNELAALGARLGSAETLELGVLANRNPPELDTHDRYGNRVDLVRYHPSYHQLMRLAVEQGLHASPWTDPRAGAHVARAARYYMQAQVEAGPRLPDHHDLRRDAEPRQRARAGARIGCRRSTLASTIRATSPPPRSRV